MCEAKAKKERTHSLTFNGDYLYLSRVHNSKSREIINTSYLPNFVPIYVQS